MAGNLKPVANRAVTKRIQDALRQQVRGELLLARIEQCVDALLNDRESRVDTVTGETTYLPLTRERIVALKSVMDVQLRLLSKVLPDLKAVELTDAEGNPVSLGGETDKLVLATKLLAVMRAAETETPDFLS